jgi:hypothetical protein
VDDRKTSISLHDLFGRDGADAASIAPGVRRYTEFEDNLVVPNPDQVERLAAEPRHESAQIVYCGTEQQVREGFAIALRVMGIETDFSPGTLCPPTISPNREDN